MTMWADFIFWIVWGITAIVALLITAVVVSCVVISDDRTESKPARKQLWMEKIDYEESMMKVCQAMLNAEPMTPKRYIDQTAYKDYTLSNRPENLRRAYHLSKHSKSQRVRKKNIRRLQKNQKRSRSVHGE